MGTAVEHLDAHRPMQRLGEVAHARRSIEVVRLRRKCEIEHVLTPPAERLAFPSPGQEN
jgi:hypothetical protein